jgi:uncharacterized protein
MTEPSSRTLLIFAKPPRIGLAKTRLARSLGSQAEAQRINCFCAVRTFRAALDPRWQTRLYAAPDKHLADTLGGAWPAHVPRYRQGRGGLGERLARGLREAPKGEVVFIGTDAPGISKALIWQAFRALGHHEAAVGPASDGGFWLLALGPRLRDPTLFDGVRWSHSETLNDLLGRLSDRRVARLPTLIDVDEAADWAAYCSSRTTGAGSRCTA